VRFLLDGEIIAPKSTPEDLELEDNDLIDCRNEECTISISYRDELTMFTIRRRTKMAKLFTAFVVRNGLNAANCEFAVKVVMCSKIDCFTPMSCRLSTLKSNACAFLILSD